jgi:hypothetical protein
MKDEGSEQAQGKAEILKCWKLTWYKALDRRAQPQAAGFQRNWLYWSGAACALAPLMIAPKTVRAAETTAHPRHARHLWHPGRPVPTTRLRLFQVRPAVTRLGCADQQPKHESF